PSLLASLSVLGYWALRLSMSEHATASCALVPTSPIFAVYVDHGPSISTAKVGSLVLRTVFAPSGRGAIRIRGAEALKSGRADDPGGTDPSGGETCVTCGWPCSASRWPR